MKKSFLSVLSLLAIQLLFAQKDSSINATITGTWKGSSICQVKGSPCHDEIAIYHVSKTDKALQFQFVMNKLVNGNEEDMGVLIYSFDTATNTLTYNDDKRQTAWKFTLKGKTMDGQLFYKGQLYRIIHLEKE